MSQMSEIANSATPANSLVRRDKVDVVATGDQISMTMGSTSGRRPVRFRKNRRTSTRIASRSSPGSASKRYLSKYSLLTAPERSVNVPVRWAAACELLNELSR